MLHQNYDLETVKQAARGHWISIHVHIASIPEDYLDGAGHPCVVCGEGTDRFNAAKDVDDTGACFCRQCHMGGDGFNVLQKVNFCDLQTAVNDVAKFLGIGSAADAPPSTPTGNGEQTKAQPGRAYHDAVRAAAAAIRSKLPAGVTIPDEPITYHYQNSDGSVAGVIMRWDRSDGEKEIRPLSESSNGWVAKAMSAPRPLYRLQAVTQAEIVYICEGEKAVEAVESFGLVATTSAGGSNSAAQTDWSALDGKIVVILPDNDQPGEKYLTKVVEQIAKQAPSATTKVARIKDVWPEIPDKGDAADWSEHFCGQSGEWFRQQLETAVKALTVVSDAAPKVSTPSVPRDSDDWPDLIPFDDPDRVRLNPDVLPVSIRDMVKQVSEHTETPPEMATMVALGATATATMRKFEVEIEPGFRQPTNLYLCVVMPPGNRKSAVFRQMIDPVNEHENAIRQAAESEFRRSSADHEIWERQCADLKTKISKAVGDDILEMRRELDHLLSNTPEVIHKPQLLSDDATPESVCSLLGDNQERLGIASAEPEVFDLILGRYSKGPNLGMWLKGHDGDRHTENRRHRPEPIVLNSPLLSLTIMAQPEAIQTAGGHRVMRGRGMLDRFLFAYPPSPVGSRSCVAGTIDHQIQQLYRDRMTTLLKVSIPVDGYGDPKPRVLTLSGDAHSSWKAEQIRIERLMADSESLSSIAGWGSKFAAQVARMAANLHLLEHGLRQSVIQDVSMQQAIHIGRMIESHTRAVFQTMGQDPSKVTAQKVARHIVKDAVPELSRRDVMRIDRTIDVTDAQAAIELMVEHGYLAPLQSEKRRGRPSDRYAVNPAVLNT